MAFVGRRAKSRISETLSKATRSNPDMRSRPDRARDIAARRPKPDMRVTGTQLGLPDKPIHLPDRALHIWRDRHGTWHYRPCKIKGDYTAVTDSRVSAAFEREAKNRVPGKKYTSRTIKDLKPGEGVVAKGFAGFFMKVSDKTADKVLVDMGMSGAPTWFDREDVRPTDGVFEQAGQYFKDLGNTGESDKGKRVAQKEWAKDAPHKPAYAGRVKTVREPPPTTDAEAQRRIKDLVTDLRDSSDPQEKKKIRARLRTLGHTGGLNGGAA